MSFMPIAASTQAHTVDTIFVWLVAASAFISLLVFGLIFFFAVRYRRNSSAKRGRLPEFITREVEIGWTLATLLLFLFVFWWAASADLSALTPPANALEIHVLAKQWMWKTQHPSGAREINALHVPIDRPVRLLMQSEDVIHSFFVPAFRIKQDVLPGRDAPTELWFQASKLGTFQLLCAEYCGTNHSGMRGRIVVMRQQDYADWSTAQPGSGDLARQGQALFVATGCSGCHGAASRVHAPPLDGLFGRRVVLTDGRSVVADEAYIRDSILQPNRDVVAGYEPIMPSFVGILDDGEIQSLIAYIKSLRKAETTR
jgi:cytochrome c oxidase subunit 2